MLKLLSGWKGEREKTGEGSQEQTQQGRGAYMSASNPPRISQVSLADTQKGCWLPGKAVGGAGVGTAMGTPTLPLPLFSRLLLRLLLGWLPPLLPLLIAGRSTNR